MVATDPFHATREDPVGPAPGMRENNRPEWTRVAIQALTALLAALALALMTLFAVAALRRAAFPFPLEQHEGAMALAVARVAHGQPLYLRPDLHFIPYMYAPAYFYVAGFVAKLAGPGLLALRLVSFFSTLGCFVLIGTWVHAETGDRMAALAGAGLYAAAYPVTQDWFDLGRVDSLYVFFVLLALLATRRSHPAVAALVWTLAFLTKQTIAPVALVTLCFDWKRPRRLLVGVGTFLLTSFGSTVWLDHGTHGWYTYYVFTVPHANADLRLHAAAFFFSTALLVPFGVALGVVAAALLLTNVHWDGPRVRFYLFSGVSLLLLCWFLGAHNTATANTAMPVYALLAVAFGIALARLLQWLRGTPAPNAQAGTALLLLAACAQLAGQVYSPKLTAPAPALRDSQQQLVDWLRSFPGDVLVVSHPYEAVLAGKHAYADEAAIHDALRPGVPAINRPLLQEMRQAMDSGAIGAIVLDRTPEDASVVDPWLPADLRTQWPLLGLVPGSDHATSFGPHPRYVLLPCRALDWDAVRSVVLLSPDAAWPCPGAAPR